MDFKEIMAIADNMDVEATAEKILQEMEKDECWKFDDWGLRNDNREVIASPTRTIGTTER